jgi:NTP pyrophosphatase (non-canonical NTP hydrolase)
MATAKVTDTEAIRDADLDRELADVLIAISVITRQLARKINVNLKKTEGNEDVQELWTDGRDRQSET